MEERMRCVFVWVHRDEVSSPAVDVDVVVLHSDHLVGLGHEESGAAELRTLGREGELTLHSHHVQTAWRHEDEDRNSNSYCGVLFIIYTFILLLFVYHLLCILYFSFNFSTLWWLYFNLFWLLCYLKEHYVDLINLSVFMTE